jgi:hypothetical protein
LLSVLSCTPALAPVAVASPRATAAAQVGHTHHATRRALLIGNGAYAGAPLPHPVGDVNGLAAALRAIGWTVDVATDLDRRAMRETVAGFAGELAPADVALVYYAGHGLAIDGRNYLLPVDFDATTAADAKEDAYPLDLVQDQVTAHGGISLIVTDACRDEPFTRSWSRGARIVGFVQPAPALSETFIAFSTQAGAPAQDGRPSDAYSPFAGALIRELGVPGRDLDGVFRAVKADVRDATGGDQQPWTMDDLTQGFGFDGTVEDVDARLARSTTPVGTAWRSVGPARWRALVVAIGDYDGGNHFEVDGDIARLMPAFTSLGVGADDLAIVRDADRAGFLAALDRLTEAAQPGDRVWLQFSGIAVPGPGGALLFRKYQAFDAADPDTVPAAELVLRLDALRRKVGERGAVDLVLDASSVLAPGDLPRTVAGQSPLVVVQIASGLGIEVRDDQGNAVGVVSLTLAGAIANREPGATWTDVVAVASRQVAELEPRELAVLGDRDTEVETGARGHRGPQVTVDRTRRYGTYSVFLDQGRLDGVFAGTEVTWAGGAHGTVVQTGLRGARIELDPATAALASGAPAVSAPAPAPGAPPVVAEPALAATLGPLGIGVGDGEPRWIAETNYAVLIAAGGATSEPVAIDDAARLVGTSWAASWRAWLAAASARPSGLAWLPDASAMTTWSSAPTRGAHATCLGPGGSGRVERWFRYAPDAPSAVLSLLALAPDGTLRAVATGSAAGAPGGLPVVGCVQLDAGESLVAIGTARPWDARLLLAMTANPSPFERLAAPRPEEIPRGRVSGPSIASLDDADDAVAIDVLAP